MELLGSLPSRDSWLAMLGANCLDVSKKPPTWVEVLAAAYALGGELCVSLALKISAARLSGKDRISVDTESAQPLVHVDGVPDLHVVADAHVVDLRAILWRGLPLDSLPFAPLLLK